MFLSFVCCRSNVPGRRLTETQNFNQLRRSKSEFNLHMGQSFIFIRSASEGIDQAPYMLPQFPWIFPVAILLGTPLLCSRVTASIRSINHRQLFAPMSISETQSSRPQKNLPPSAWLQMLLLPLPQQIAGSFVRFNQSGKALAAGCNNEIIIHSC